MKWSFASLMLIMLFTACAPSLSNSDVTLLETPQAKQTEETAQIAFHQMEIGFLQTGEYTTNALIDLAIPKGIKWTLESFGTSDYQLKFSSDDVPGFAWLVTPKGVKLTDL